MNGNFNQLRMLEAQFSGNGSSASNRRILRDYTGLQKLLYCEIAFQDHSNMYIWNLSMDTAHLNLGPMLNNDLLNTRENSKET